MLTGTNSLGELAFGDARRGWIAGVERRAAHHRRRPQLGAAERDGELLARIAALSGTAALGQDRGAKRFYATTSGGAAGAASRLSITPSKRRLTRAATRAHQGPVAPRPGRRVHLRHAALGHALDARRIVRAASNGSFTVSFRVRRSSQFVAQWAGDDRLAGDGTTAVKVTVKKRKRKRR